MPQTLRFHATEGSEPAAEKGPARSAADVAHLASMLNPQSEAGGVRLAKGAVTHLRFHDGTKVGSARLDKVLGYLAAHLGVDEADVQDALTFGNHAPTAALAKTAFVLAHEMADAGALPAEVPAALLVGAAGPGDGGEARASREAELSKLLKARDAVQAQGFDVDDTMRQRIEELESALGNPDPAPTEPHAPEPEEPAAAAPPWQASVTALGARLDTIQDLLAGVINADHHQVKDDSRIAAITARAEVVAAEAAAEHFRSLGVEVPPATRARLAEAKEQLAAARLARRSGTEPGSDLMEIHDQHPLETPRAKRKFDGSGQLQRDVLEVAGPGHKVAMADFELISGWSAATRAKLAAGTFIEFPKLYHELQEGAATKKKKVLIEEGQLVVDDGTAAAVAGSETFKSLEHHAHAQVFNAWLRLMRQVHASNGAVLRDFNRLEARILRYAQDYPGVGYQRYLRAVRQRMAHVAELGSSVGTHLQLGFGDADPDLFLRVFGAAARETSGPTPRHGEGATSGRRGPKSACFKYNDAEGCPRTAKACRYKHKCSECGGDHPAHRCQKGNASKRRRVDKAETAEDDE